MTASAALLERHGAAIAALSAVPHDPAAYVSVDDDALLELARVNAREQQLVTTSAALIAGEIARRSSTQLGSTGLAQRLGHRTPQELVRVTTGSTKREASTSVRVGQLVTSPSVQPWLTPVGTAVAQHTLSVASAEAIRNGLGEPTENVTPSALSAAAAELCELAVTIDADRLYILAREKRDAIDEAGILERERRQYAQRSLRFRRLPDGMGQLNWTLDPESAALVSELFDRATSPRRGGPRFVNPADVATSDAVLNDGRTTEQLVSDVFLQLLRSGADRDSSQLLGTGAPVLRILVTEKALAAGEAVGSSDEPSLGHGHLEGESTTISKPTFERIACGATMHSVTFGDKAVVIDVGREQRLYTRVQRAALAARDGGCRWPGCERPPSWCEAHHTKFWARDHGKTNLEDGILLCRHHHLLSHNNGWEITHTDGNYFLIPPRDIDPQQRPIPMPTKSAALRELFGV